MGLLLHTEPTSKSNAAALRSEPVLRPTSCPCAAIRRTGRALTQLFDLVLSPAGIKITQFTILNALQENGEIAQWDMSRQLGISTEGLSRRLSSLRKAGWIKMRTGGARSEHLYSLTPEGKAKLEAATPYWKGAQARLQASTSPEDWAALISLADRITVAARVAEQKRTTNGTLKVSQPGSPLTPQA